MKKDQEKEIIVGALIIAVLVLLFGVFLPSGKEAKQHSDIYSDPDKQFAWNELGKETIKSRLKDSESATFKDLTFHAAQLQEGKKIPITCGFVNSKNSFGGYTGFQRFIAAGETLSFLEEEVDDFSKVWSTYCH